MAQEGQEERKVTFETHTGSEAGAFIAGRHASQRTAEPEPADPGAGATGPAAEPTGPASTGPDFFSEKPPETDPQTRIKELEEENRKLKGTESSITDSELYKLQVIKKEHPEEYDVFRKFVLGSLSDAELWKLEFVRKYPAMKDDAEGVQRKFERTFPGLSSEVTTQEYRDANSDLKLDASQVRNSLTERLSKIQMAEPQNTEDASVKERTALVADWKPEFTSAVTNFTKYPLEVTLPDKSVQTVDIEIPNATQVAIGKEAAAYLLHNKLPKTPENIQKVKEFMTERYRASAEAQAAIVTKTSEVVSDYWRKKTGNNAAVHSRGVPPGETVSGQQALVNKLTQKT